MEVHTAIDRLELRKPYKGDRRFALTFINLRAPEEEEGGSEFLLLFLVVITIFIFCVPE